VQLSLMPIDERRLTLGTPQWVSAIILVDQLTQADEIGSSRGTNPSETKRALRSKGYFNNIS